MTDMALAPHGSSPGLTHLYYSGPVQWPFGFGESYTTFSFDWSLEGGGKAVVAAESLAAGDAPLYRVNVTNTGHVVSDVSVLGFFSTGLPGEPLQELFDFSRVAALAAGASAEVTLTLPPGVAATIDSKGKRWATPGSFLVRVGEPGNFAEGSLEVRGEATLLLN